MKTPARFKAGTKYEEAQDKKANTNLPVMAEVGDGGGVANVPNRDNFYWIRLVADDNRLTQCRSLIPLSDGDVVYVKRARDRKLSFYEFVAFIQDSTGSTAPPIQVHDHHDIPRGGPDLNPETISPQTFLVGPAPCPHNTLGEAVTAVNAFGPTAANPAVILVMGIVTAEAGNVTIPNYCHVVGEGEGSTIGLGAFQLNMGTDTSLLNLKITSTSGNGVVWDDASGFMHNVHIIADGTTGVLTANTVTLHAFRVFVENTPATALAAGFRIAHSAGGVTLDTCEVNGDTITDALDVNSHSVVSRYCRFNCWGDDVDVAAGATWYHFACQFTPTSVTMAGGHTALATKRFEQTVIVAETGGDFQRLSEAITWINALGDAAANKLYGILMLAGNYAETGNVTIPQYVSVMGMDEGTEIEMGANVLSLSSDSELKDVVVETTMDVTTKYCINVQDATSVKLFNVRVRYTPYATGSSIAFYFQGASSGAAYHCVAEPLGGGASVIGFAAEDTANILLWDCEADDTTNFDDGLYLGDDATVISKYCMFHADGDDVDVGVDATWTYHQDDFDPDNCTVTGTAEPADGQEVVYFPCTKTAGAAGDFATVQAAIDWFENRLLCAVGKVAIVTGATYNETLVIEDIFCTGEGRFELEGDTRGMAGATWVDDAVITCQDANAGAGVCSLANAGNVITVTGAGGNPDFDADGWGNGDTCIIRDNAGAIATYNISATLNNTITLTVAAPAVGNTGTSITLVPNTVVAPSGAGDAVTVEAQGILLDGLYLNATAGASGNGLLVNPGAECQCENILITADDMAFYAIRGGYIEAADGSCTAVSSVVGFYATQGAPMLADRAVAVGCSVYGFGGDRTGFCHASYAVATDCDIGFAGAWLGGIRCQNSYSLQNSTYGFWATRHGFNDCWTSRTLGTNGTDYRADYNSYMYAVNTNVGGPTYSPAVSDTEGNVYAIITWS